MSGKEKPFAPYQEWETRGGHRVKIYATASPEWEDYPVQGAVALPKGNGVEMIHHKWSRTGKCLERTDGEYDIDAPTPTAEWY